MDSRLGPLEEDSFVPLIQIRFEIKDNDSKNLGDIYRKVEKSLEREISSMYPKSKNHTKDEDMVLEGDITDKSPKKQKKSKTITEPLLTSQNRASRLDTVLANIENRERKVITELATAIPGKKKKSEKPIPKGDNYESDDSWIDDSEYTDLLTLEGGDDLEENEKIYSDDEEPINQEENPEAIPEGPSQETSEEKEKRATPKKKSEKPRVALHDEIEAVIKEMEIKATDKGMLKTKKYAKELFDPEMSKIALLREKHYPKGVPKELIERIQEVLDFSDKYLKNLLKNLLESNGLSSAKKNLADCKTKFVATLKKYMLEAFEKKELRSLKKDAPSSPKSEEGSLSQFPETTQDVNSEKVEKPMSYEEIRALVDEAKLFAYAKSQKLKLIWNNALKRDYIAWQDAVVKLVTVNNEMRESGITKNPEMDKAKELDDFYSEVKNFWPTGLKAMDAKYENFKKELDGIKEEKKSAKKSSERKEGSEPIDLDAEPLKQDATKMLKFSMFSTPTDEKKKRKNTEDSTEKKRKKVETPTSQGKIFGDKKSPQTLSPTTGFPQVGQIGNLPLNFGNQARDDVAFQLWMQKKLQTEGVQTNPTNAPMPPQPDQHAIQQPFQPMQQVQAPFFGFSQNPTPKQEDQQDQQ